MPSSNACGIAIAGPFVCNPVGYSCSRSITFPAYSSDTYSFAVNNLLNLFIASGLSSALKFVVTKSGTNLNSIFSSPIYLFKQISHRAL